MKEERTLRDAALEAAERRRRDRARDASRLVRQVLGKYAPAVSWNARPGFVETELEGLTFVVRDSAPEALLVCRPDVGDFEEVPDLPTLGELIAEWEGALAEGPFGAKRGSPDVG